MNIQTKALLVHLFTATGAVWAMLAMLAAVDGKWNVMFMWLVVALFVDGVDGPLARKYMVKKYAPTFDGVLLDLIIDYLTYVFIPAFALFQSGLLPGWTGWCAIIVITYASAIYFVDTRMKTKDNSFAGFPACWNMVVIVLFAIEPNFYLMLAIIVALAATMFTNLKFVHPVRTERWRKLTLPVTLLWVLLAGWSVWDAFAPPQAVKYGLLASSAYLLGVGMVMQALARIGSRDGEPAMEARRQGND